MTIREHKFYFLVAVLQTYCYLWTENAMDKHNGHGDQMFSDVSKEDIKVSIKYKESFTNS